MLEIRMSIVLGLSVFIFRWLSLLKCSGSISFIKCHEYQAGNCSKKWFLKEIYIIMNRGNSYQVILTNADVCMVWHIGIPKETSFFFCISSVALPNKQSRTNKTPRWTKSLNLKLSDEMLQGDKDKLSSARSSLQYGSSKDI